MDAKRRVTIINKLGLHARAAAKLAKLASGFESDVLLRRDEQSVNAKSIVAVMMLASTRGTDIEIQAQGHDAVEAVMQLEALVLDRFGESE
mgnify:CR=1 FL=1